MPDIDRYSSVDRCKLFSDKVARLAKIKESSAARTALERQPQRSIRTMIDGHSQTVHMRISICHHDSRVGHVHVDPWQLLSLRKQPAVCSDKYLRHLVRQLRKSARFLLPPYCNQARRWWMCMHRLNWMIECAGSGHQRQSHWWLVPTGASAMKLCDNSQAKASQLC